MPTTYRIDKKIKNVFVFSKGDTQLSEFIDLEMKIIEDPKFEKGYNSYIDLSKAQPSPNESFEKIKKLADFIEQIKHQRGKCKWSVYAPTEDAYNFSVIFARLIKHLEIEVKIFKNEHEAIKWLGILTSLNSQPANQRDNLVAKRPNEN